MSKPQRGVGATCQGNNGVQVGGLKSRQPAEKGGPLENKNGQKGVLYLIITVVVSEVRLGTPDPWADHRLENTLIAPWRWAAV